MKTARAATSEGSVNGDEFVLIGDRKEKTMKTKKSIVDNIEAFCREIEVGIV